jgi:diaminohydroxyphosphoribosylaminopyrimidine deaminase / 5-amino-6-(5-phosphoribosylamino)uracil reductase
MPWKGGASAAVDAGWMQRALQLAEGAIGLSDPNPRVGCVLVSPDGHCLAEGHTQAAGQAHAEAMALRQAVQRGLSTRGATVYVTLEPCSHHGRTPPCCEALVSAGVARVVIACEDPHSKVNGAGIAHLRAHGIEVHVGLLRDEAEALNVGFLHRVRSGRPWVRLKWACSLDARTALPDGRSQWITGPEARSDGIAWRRRAGALLTGVGTVLADDPRFDVRNPEPARAPARWVLDRRLRTPASARLFSTQGAVHLVHALAAEPAQADALRQAGASLWASDGRLDSVLDELGRREVNEVHVEAGATLSGAWLAAGLVDELLIYMAPRLLGPGRGVADLPALPSLDDAQSWTWLDAVRVGNDLRLRLRRPG